MMPTSAIEKVIQSLSSAETTLPEQIKGQLDQLKSFYEFGNKFLEKSAGPCMYGGYEISCRAMEKAIYDPKYIELTNESTRISSEIQATDGSSLSDNLEKLIAIEKAKQEIFQGFIPQATVEIGESLRRDFDAQKKKATQWMDKLEPGSSFVDAYSPPYMEFARALQKDSSFEHDYASEPEQEDNFFSNDQEYFKKEFYEAMERAYSDDYVFIGLNKTENAMTHIIASGYLAARFTGSLGVPHGNERLKDTLASFHGPPYAMVAKKDLKKSNGWYKIPAENVIFIASEKDIQNTRSDIDYIRKAGFLVPDDNHLMKMLQQEEAMKNNAKHKTLPTSVPIKKPDAESKSSLFKAFKDKFEELTRKKPEEAEKLASKPSVDVTMQDEDEWVLPSVVNVNPALVETAPRGPSP